MIALSALLLCSVFLLATATFAVFIARSKQATTLIYGLSFGLSAIAFAIAVDALATAASPDAASTLVLPIGLPWIGSHFRLDPLSSFFLTVINFGGMLSSLYALGYGRHEHAPHRVLPFFPAFVAGMNLVTLADDAFTFLMSWEFMSLASWALVIAHHRDTDNRKAGYLYIVMASFGTLTLLLAFGLLAGPDGNYSFASMRAAEHTSLTSGLVLVLLLVGAGSKAGLAPLHVWLPRAHPAAPSHVSALMSGVMTKVAVYGFIRVIFDLLGTPAWWFGVAVLAIGGITAVLGILHALMEGDLKRLLAYSTIENIGVIFISLGLALAFKANGMGLPAALALTAALFHVLNHSFFKSLLFFGAGAVLTATGERDMEKLGGLIHRMPATAVVFLAGCIAISALPPFNGFVSEWLTFQAVLQSPALPQWGLKLLVPAVGGLLALTAALAAACFVKVFGVTFLGRPRTGLAERATEVDAFSLSAMSVLAFLCLAAGVLPGIVIDALAPLTLSLIGQRMSVQTDIPWLSIVPIAEAHSSYNGLLVFLFILFSASFTAYLVHRFGSRRIRRAPAWDCGFPINNPATQYTASSFAQPIRRVFGTLIFRARDRVTIPPPGDIRPARFTLEMHDHIWEGVYLPIVGAIGFAAEKLNYLQFLTIRRYLSLVFLTLVLLLLVLALWS
ncbi:hydrogenase component B [Rhizobium freirei PRF 81]|uniref:Hydrogenase component B n=1 Tax=Rhizobium freirei PRF 81 TaxID=363754 RepID=N6U2D8_9HYPH|nr:hydrogenase 4 subunit B [Rhizobium freirei]ENN86804.1 hydrogenase component B [Rhizobium freirei PRF 81]